MYLYVHTLFVRSVAKLSYQVSHFRWAHVVIVAVAIHRQREATGRGLFVAVATLKGSDPVGDDRDIGWSWERHGFLDQPHPSLGMGGQRGGAYWHELGRHVHVRVLLTRFLILGGLQGVAGCKASLPV